MARFDYQSAKNAGYSDGEIRKFLEENNIPLPKEIGVGGVAGFGIGALKGVTSTISGAGELGSRALGGITPGKFRKPEEQRTHTIIPEAKRTPQGTAEKIGFGAEQIGELFVPGAKVYKAAKGISNVVKGGKVIKAITNLGTRAIGETAVVGGQRAIQEGEVNKDVVNEALTVGAGSIVLPGAVKLLGKGVKGFSKGTSNFLFGPSGTAGFTARYRDPKGVYKFITSAKGGSGATTQNIADIMVGAVDDVKTGAVNALKQAESKLVTTKLSPQQVKSQTLNKIKEFLNLELTPVRGKTGKFTSSLDEAAIKNSFLDETEERLIIKIVNKIKGNTDFSAKGVLNLRRNIDNFFRGTQAAGRSDAIVTQVRNHLNELLGSIDPVYKAASTKYSKTRELLDKLGINILGKSKLNVEQTANKIVQIAKNLDDPFMREASEGLLKQLERETGLPFVKVLRNLATAMNLNPQSSRGLRAGVVKELVRYLENIVSKGAGAAGRIRQTLPGAAKGTQGFFQQSKPQGSIPFVPNVKKKVKFHFYHNRAL